MECDIVMVGDVRAVCYYGHGVYIVVSIEPVASLATCVFFGRPHDSPLVRRWLIEDVRRDDLIARMR